MNDSMVIRDLKNLAEQWRDENRKLCELIADMHAMLQRCCDEVDISECVGQGSRCVMWSDPNDDCDMRKIEERIRAFGIEVMK